MKKKVMLPLALLLSLAAALSMPKAEAHHWPPCALDQWCVNGCEAECGGFNQCFHNCIQPGCCIP